MIKFTILFIFFLLLACGKMEKQHKTFIFDFDLTLHGWDVNRSEAFWLNVVNEDPKKFQAIQKYFDRSQIKYRIINGSFKEMSQKYGVKIRQINVEFMRRNFQEHLDPKMIREVKRIREAGSKIVVIGAGRLGCLFLPEFLSQYDIQKSEIYSGYFKSRKLSDLITSLEGDFRFSNCANPDLTTPFSQNKSDIVRFLLKKNIISGKTIYVGDGLNDLEVWQAGVIDKFIGFGVHKQIPDVAKNAPIFVKNMSEFELEIRREL
jgi:phosphoserine phosphatase